jgi:hypothetical protein
MNENLILITSKLVTIRSTPQPGAGLQWSSSQGDILRHLKAEGSISTDKTIGIVNVGGHSSQIVHSADGEDSRVFRPS